MITKVQKWGNSQGLRLSKELLSDVEINVGDMVDVAVRDGAIVVTPVRRVRGGHNLRELVRRIPKDYKPEGLDWGESVGGRRRGAALDSFLRESMKGGGV
jgi:antitoxin MazE